MKDYDKLKEIIDEIDCLIQKNVDSSSPEFQAWKVKTERFLIKKYGEKSYEVKNFRNHSFSLSIFTFDTPDSAFVKACRDDLKAIKAIFQNYLIDIKEEIESEAKQKGSEGEIVEDFNKVFIVHGHNGELKEAVARLIERQGIKPIILSEQTNRGATIIEKIESNSDVQAAVCLFTADDFGKGRNEQCDNLRARQNVIFETGYFIGKLGRQRTVIISDKEIELPSDLQGVVYTNISEWRFMVLKELKAIGYNIDYNKIDM